MGRPGRRIVVVGTPGCGKSYVAEILSSRLKIPYVCHDALIWQKDWEPVPRADRERAFSEALEGEAWTLDGNIGGLIWPEHRLVARRMDTIIWLDLPRFDVWRQMLVRTVQRIMSRETLWNGNRETWHSAFASDHAVALWAFQSYSQHRREYQAMFTSPEFAAVTKIRLTQRAQVDRWLKQLEQG